MRLLLDTHVLLWWLDGTQRVAPPTATLMADPATTVVVSAASIWEIEIKRSLGRLTAPDDVLEQVPANSFELLSISGRHAVEAARLPRHHDDLFDRVLIAQAVAEGLTLVTRDARMAAYQVALLAA